MSKNPAEHALSHTVATTADKVFSQFGSFVFTISHIQYCLSHTLNLFSFHFKNLHNLQFALLSYNIFYIIVLFVDWQIPLDKNTYSMITV